MTIRRKLFSLFLALMVAFGAIAQDASYKITNQGVIKTEADGEEYNILKPILALKTKYEYDTEDGYSKFSVKHARLGMTGEASQMFSYRFQVDFCAENKLSVLDLYAVVKPVNRLSVTVGQHAIPLFNSWTVSPNAVDYINRPFTGKYFTSSRDIGVTAKYALKKGTFPINVEFGVYNGTGINNPTWNKSMATGGRVEFGSVKEGFRATAKYYSVKNSDDLRDLYWGADVRYAGDAIKLEAEVMTKNIAKADVCASCSGPAPYVPGSLTATHVQAMYKIKSNSTSFKRIEPLLRWDVMGYDFIDRGAGVNRVTAGFNFVLNTAITSMFRINYEQYFNNSKDMSALYKEPQYNHNKLSLEYLIYF